MWLFEKKGPNVVIDLITLSGDRENTLNVMNHWHFTFPVYFVVFMELTVFAETQLKLQRKHSQLCVMRFLQAPLRNERITDFSFEYGFSGGIFVGAA